MVNPNRTGRTVVPGSIVSPTGDGAGLDKILEVVGDGPAAGSAQAFFLVISGAEPGRLHVLGKPELVIGRSKFADIRISERAMSQQHAKVVRTPEGHRLFDLGSTNGTFVNEQQIESVDLNPGDVVRTGETTFTYMASGAADPGASDSTMALPSTSKRSRVHTPQPPSTGSALMIRPRVTPARVGAAPQVINAPAIAMPEDEGSDMVGMVVRVLDFAKRYWLSTTIFTILGAGLGVASYKVSKPPVTANFEVHLMPKATDNLMERGRRMNFEFFRSAQKSFNRPALVRRALKELGDDDVKANEIRGIQRSLSFKQADARAKQVYAGSFQAKSAEAAMEYLRVHLKLYLDEEIDKALKVLLLEVNTFENKLEEAENDLNATEQAIMAFKQEHVEGLPEQAGQLYTELFSLGSERGRAAAEVARAAETVRVKRKHLKSEAPEIEARIDKARSYESAIAEVKRDLVAKRASGKGNQHPEVKALRKELDNLEALRDDVMKNGGGGGVVRSRNPLYEGHRVAKDEAEAALRIAQSELSRLTNNRARTKRMVDELPRLQQEYTELTRDYEATKKIHGNLFDKLNSSRIQLDMERASASTRYEIITPPNVEQVSKVKTIVVRAGALGFLGLAFGIFLGLLRDLRRAISTRIAQQQRR